MVTETLTRTAPMPDDVRWIERITQVIHQIDRASPNPKYSRAIGHLSAARAVIQERIDGT